MSINLNVNGNTAPLEAAVQAAVNRIRKTPIKVTVDDKGATQPLGNMKRGADEFSKSMEAANARIIAFGASMAIINGISDAFKAMVANVVQVEKALADINVVMGLSLANLDKFSDSLFKVAKETAASFDVAAAAATEYARQGLAVEETLKRTKDALILTRLTGMDSANAVKALTAAMNTYGDQIKDTTQLVSKFAAVDVKFAVSAEDFADAISRTGQAAKSAGVDIDELVGLVTAAQQKTARGGKVIGNSFKTIFTRIGRTDTLNQLENLGIAVRDVEGNTIGAKRILTDLANTFDSLTESQKAQIAQTVGGVFQINVLKAVLSDAAKQNGILANATQISAGATDEAIQKNEQLRSTMSAMASETGLALKEVSAKIGELAIAPGMEKILNIVKGFAEGASDMLGDGESSGNKFATGFLKGLGNIITGPGLVVIVAVFGKLFLKAAQYARESLSSLIGVTSEAQKQKAIQTSLVTLFGQNAALSKEMLRTDISRTEKERIILGLLKAQVVEANALNTIARSSAANLYQKGYGSNLAPRGKPRRTSAQGYIPNYVDAERQQAAQGGYAAGSIRSMNMPGEGSVIYNSAEKVKNFKGMSQPAIMPPKSSKAGENYQQAFDSIHGFDPYAAGGYIPNFARGGKGTGPKPRIDLSNPAIMEEIDRKTKYLNAGSSNYIGLSASLGPDQPKQTFYVAGGSGTDSGIFNQKGRAFYKKAAMQRAAPRKIDVEFKSLDEKDERKGRQRYDDEINDKLQKRSAIIASGMLKTFGYSKMTPSAVRQDLPKNKMSTVAGHIFEAVTKSVLRSVGAEAAIPDKENELIDLLPNQELYKLFGVDKGKGSSGAEAKINTNLKNVMGFARKIYSSDPTTKTPLDLKSLPVKKNKAYGHIPNFAAARIALTGGLVGKNKFGNIDRRQMTRLVRSNPYFNGLMNEHLTWDSFPKKDKRKLSRWLLKQGVSNRALQAYGLASMHSKSIGEGISNLAMAKGYIPNFADPLSDAIGREKEAGVPVSKIRIGSHPALMGKSNPVGLGVTNTDDEPNGLRDVFGAANGYVPNYAPTPLTYSDIGSGRSGGSSAAQAQMEKSAKQYNKSLQKLIKLFERKKLSHEQLIKGSNNLNQKYRVNASASSKVSTQLNSMQGSISKAKAGLSSINSKFAGSKVGKAFGSSGGQMALMMGLPMAAGFAKDAIGGTAGAATGGFLEGAGSGAAMGMMFGPLGTAIGATVGGLYGLIDGLGKAEEAAIAKAKAEMDQSKNMGSSLVSVFREFPEVQKNLKDFRAQYNKIESLRNEEASKTKTVNVPAVHAPGFSMPATTKTIKDPEAQDAARGYRQEMSNMVDAQFSKALKELPKDYQFSAAGSDPEGEAFTGTGEEYAKELEKVLDPRRKTAMYESFIKAQLADEAKISKAKKEELKTIIIRLNHQKAMLVSQRESAMTQLRIKEKYSASADLLGFQEKIMGNLMTDQQKAQNRFNKALDSASEKLESSQEAAELKLKQGLMTLIKSSDTLQSAVRADLAVKREASPFEAKTIDVTKPYAEKSSSEILEVIHTLKLDGKDRLAVEALVFEKKSSDEVAKSNKTFNDTSARSALQRDSYFAREAAVKKNLERSNRMSSEGIRSSQKIRGFTDQVAAARRLNAVGPGYQTGREREDFTMSEKGFQLESKIKTLREEQSKTIGDLSIKKSTEENREQRYQGMVSGKIDLSTKEDWAEYDALNKSAEERKKKLEEIEQKIKNINAETDEEIESAKTLLDLEKQRLENKRKHETGPGAFGRGLAGGMKSMAEQVETMDYELGTRLPQTFANGLSGAFIEAINGAKDLDDALREAGLNFLKMIQEAMMQKMVMQMMGGLGFSQGGNVRNYSKGGNVPARVSNGEYLMSREAVNKYGGSFMHGLNARGKAPGFSSGGRTIQPGSQLSVNPGSFDSGRKYQRRQMSGFFYSGQGNTMGMREDQETVRGIIAEREAKRREEEAKARAKKQEKRAMWGMLASTVAMGAISHMMSGGIDTRTAGAKADGYTADTPSGVRSATKDGYQYSLLPGASSEGFDNVSKTRSWNPFSWGGSGASMNERQFQFNDFQTSPNYGVPLDPFGYNDPRLAYFGGKISNYANGGPISGKPGIDQIPAMLSEGEYVVKASSARQIGKPMLDRINAGKFYNGGAVSEMEEASDSGISGGKTNNINISVNIEKGSVKSENSESKGDDEKEKSEGSSLAEKIKEQILSVIIEEQRPGGVLED
jgi:TP901 family phage tail tape measure protein